MEGEGEGRGEEGRMGADEPREVGGGLARQPGAQEAVACEQVLEHARLVGEQRF